METNSYYEVAGDYRPYNSAPETAVANHEHMAPLIPVSAVKAVEFGSGWYHDAAIQDAKDAQAHPYR